MNELVTAVLKNVSPDMMKTIGSQIGLGTKDTESAVGVAVPSMVGAALKNLSGDGGGIDLGGLLGSVLGGGGGGDILGSLLGSKSKDVAESVSQKTPLSTSKATDLLVSLAPLVLQMFQNQKDLDLSSFLDQDGDGEIMDDVMKMGSSILGSFLKK